MQNRPAKPGVVVGPGLNKSRLVGLHFLDGGLYIIDE
jgi:hypothetical protein